MKPVNILLVEDNEGDILLTTEALEAGKIINSINVLRDGKQALDFLKGLTKETVNDWPDLILLDINLPKKNGHEVLQYIKSSEIIRHIPVIMLTTSSAEKDINQSYHNFANCYITKPVELNEFMNAIATIENFWVSIVKLPKRGEVNN
jgi:CheY-like chemotaxis protein